jgi:glycosyltransferase involved in cell wall biosynthesis
MTFLNIKVGVTMPAFNEEEGIISYVEDIYSIFKNNVTEVVFIISDDLSTDNTVVKIMEGSELGLPIKTVESKINTGSGPTTIRAWKESLNHNFDILINTDGDGQYEPQALFEMVNKLVNKRLHVVEGRRINRDESILRKMGSLSTKILVFIRTWKNPGDANCPTRVYDMNIFPNLLLKCPDSAVTPNMRMAVAYRKQNLKYEAFDLVFLPRRSKSNIGTLWAGGRGKFGPSLRYVKFCLKALIDWFFH